MIHRQNPSTRRFRRHHRRANHHIAEDVHRHIITVKRERQHIGDAVVAAIATVQLGHLITVDHAHGDFTTGASTVVSTGRGDGGAGPCFKLYMRRQFIRRLACDLQTQL